MPRDSQLSYLHLQHSHHVLYMTEWAKDTIPYDDVDISDSYLTNQLFSSANDAHDTLPDSNNDAHDDDELYNANFNSQFLKNQVFGSSNSIHNSRKRNRRLWKDLDLQRFVAINNTSTTSTKAIAGTSNATGANNSNSNSDNNTSNNPNIDPSIGLSIAGFNNFNADYDEFVHLPYNDDNLSDFNAANLRVVTFDHTILDRFTPAIDNDDTIIENNESSINLNNVDSHIHTLRNFNRNLNPNLNLNDIDTDTDLDSNLNNDILDSSPLAGSP
ncbi:uncharacterized protein ASCRUDRAFT_70640 [Ascoidea rubescens DSM 1968]|uniref:Uncharacterized protein n=1 Tax=Ascoidea rubescens DSM 1968 TaxID=1344418 RepID=A0A1D2VGP1_9ASCO|nr:hypothetical protein ASCRUDRAFT_70640 [Ascoidea rubescens DSM 1968]ODV60769.1 hypothetical protein ASCRUDRAFT_70640 [Ascoidea rubescens DSM 1968]